MHGDNPYLCKKQTKLLTLLHRIDVQDYRMKQLYPHIMKWFLPVLFISYMAGITLFTHSHVVNGVTIVHSHPFKKGSEHSHTTVEFQLIHLLNHVLVTDSGLIPTFAVAALSLLCILFIRPQVEPYHRSCPGVISLRAPPVA